MGKGRGRERRGDLPDLSVIVVTWNVASYLEPMAASVAASLAGSGLRWEGWVVDNGSTDGTLQIARRLGPPWRLLDLGENRGFGGANNAGMAAARGRYFLLLNPDTRVEGDALPQLVRVLEAHPEVGVVGPRLLNPDGSTQPSRRRFPSPWTAFVESTPLQRWWPEHPLLRRYYVLDRSDDEPQPVDWLVGACWALRREVYEATGGFDEAYWLFSEEMEWAWRIRRAGWAIWYWPAARVVHFGGGSSSQVPFVLHYHFHRSRILFWRRHFGPRWGEALRLWTLLLYAVQALVEGGKWAVGHKRPLRRQRLAVYLRLLRSGLR